MHDMSNGIVDVIIVTAGVKDYIKICLESLGRQTCLPNRIIVIDNSPERKISRELKSIYNKVEFYSEAINLSYGLALNKGIGMSEAAFTLCLNDDLTLDREYIKEALRGFSVDEKIGMVSGKILRADTKTIDSAGLFLSCWRTACERGYGIKDKGQFDRESYIFGVTGAVGFYRKKMLEEIKINSEYFDSDYGFFYEDLDIAWRAQNLSWKAYYVPKAVAYHVRGLTTRQGKGINKRFARTYLSKELYRDLVKNRYLSMIKNERLVSFLIRLPFILLYDIFVWLYALIFRPWLLRLFFTQPLYINSAIQKRKMINSLRKNL